MSAGNPADDFFIWEQNMPIMYDATGGAASAPLPRGHRTRNQFPRRRASDTHLAYRSSL